MERNKTRKRSEDSGAAGSSESGGSSIPPSARRQRSSGRKGGSDAGERKGKAPRSHVATEQRRRDRINDGFNALRELIPHKDKLDKAAFLGKTIDYIRQLQAVLQQLLDMGVVSTLPEDLQWNIRMLLPRQPNLGPTPAASAQPSAQPTLTTASLGGVGGATANGPTRPVATSAAPAANDYMQYLLQNPQLLQLATQQLQAQPQGQAPLNLSQLLQQQQQHQQQDSTLLNLQSWFQSQMQAQQQQQPSSSHQGTPSAPQLDTAQIYQIAQLAQALSNQGQQAPNASS